MRVFLGFSLFFAISSARFCTAQFVHNFSVWLQAIEMIGFVSANSASRLCRETVSRALHYFGATFSQTFTAL